MEDLMELARIYYENGKFLLATGSFMRYAKNNELKKEDVEFGERILSQLKDSDHNYTASELEDILSKQK